MSTKFRYDGDLIPYANTGSAITSGSVVVVKAGRQGFVGVAEDDIPATTGFGHLRVDGVVELAALSTDTGVLGDQFYWDATNSRLTTTPTGNTRAGVLVKPKASGDTTAEIKLGENELSMPGMAYSAVAASSALANTTTETAFDNASYTIPAATLRVGDVIRVRAQVTNTSGNSTDTLTLKLKIGSTVVVATAAVDVTDGGGDVGYVDAEIVVRTIGASGTFVAAGVQGLGVPGTVTAKPFFKASTALDTTAAAVVSLTGTWSAASASDSCRCDVFDVELVR